MWIFGEFHQKALIMFSASTNFANDVQGTLCANNEMKLIWYSGYQVLFTFYEMNTSVD